MNVSGSQTGGRVHRVHRALWTCLGLPLWLLVAQQATAAGVACKVTCAGKSAACKAELLDTEKGNRLADLPQGFADCERGSIRSPDSLLMVWYVRNATLVGKLVPANTPVGPHVKDGDASCAGIIDCLFNRPSGKVAGASPMGRDGGQDSAQSSGAKVGLPYDTVVVAGPALLLQAQADDANGSLTVTDKATGAVVVQVPVARGRAQLPSTSLTPGQQYAYRWVTSAGALDGSFSTARTATVERVERQAAKRVEDNGLVGLAERYARVSAYTSAGLSWDAARLLADAERE